MSRSGRWSRSGIFSEGQSFEPIIGEAESSHFVGNEQPAAQFLCTDCNVQVVKWEVHQKWHSSRNVQYTSNLFKTPPIPDKGPPRAEFYDNYEDSGLSQRSFTEPSTSRSRRLKCNLCGEVFTNRSRWSEHILEEHEQTAKRAKLAQSENDDEEEEEFEQEDADEEEYAEEEEDEEEEDAMSEEQYEESADGRGSGEEDIIADENNRPYCDECDLAFYNMRGLSAHITRKHRRRLDGSSINSSRQETNYDNFNQTGQDYAARRDVQEEGEEYAGDTDASQHIHNATTIPELSRPTMLQEGVDSLNLSTGGAESSVDIYPCKFCKDRVFLTSFGLERHTKLTHPDNFKDVLEYIETLHRDREPPAPVKATLTHAPGRGRKGIAFAKKIDAILAKEHEPKSPDSDDEFDFTFPTVGDRDMYADALSDDDDYVSMKYQQMPLKKEDGMSDNAHQQQQELHHLHHQQQQIDDSMELYDQPPLQAFRQHKAAIVAAASFTDSRGHGRPRRSVEAQRAKYQSCETCGILINTENPKAMESHDKAHKRNRELREELLRLYGAAWVDRVTCKECNLVFKDEDKLEQHRRHVHVRRRHFLCRFCGDVFRNMRDLNMHKERRHEAFEGHRRGADPSVFSYTMSSFYKRNMEDRRLMEAGNFPEVWITPIDNVCPECDDEEVFDNARELVKHMFSMHDEFPTPLVFKSKDYAPLMCDVNEGNIYWACCDLCTVDMTEMLNHRQLKHGTSLTGRPQTCEYCNTVLTHRKAYDNHVRMHRYRQCKICQVWFDSTKEGFLAYRTHMRDHRDHGHEIKEVQVNDIRSKETELIDAITEEEQWGVSEDEHSVYTESGVESDVEDEESPEKLLNCHVCGFSASCPLRMRAHVRMHGAAAANNNNGRQQNASAKFRCGLCGRRFANRGSRSKHYLNCVKRRRGFIVDEKLQMDKLLQPSKATEEPSKPSADQPKLNMANVDMELVDEMEMSPKHKVKLPDEEVSGYVLKPVPMEENENEVTGFQCPTCETVSNDPYSALTHCQEAHLGGGGEEEEEEEEEYDASPKRKKTRRASTDEDELKDGYECGMFTVTLVPSEVDKTLTTIKHRCQLCRRGFADKAALADHMETHETRKQYRCKICRKRYWTSEGLREHLKIHDVNHLYCQTCFGKFPTVESLKRHEIFHELSNSLYQCEDCSMSYCGFAQLQTHFKEAHTGISILTCPICAQIHTDRNTLTQHLIQEHPKLNTKCPRCDRVFSCPLLARNHTRRMHMLRGDEESCYACGKTFRDKMSFIIHKWRHLCEHDYQCRVCDLSFGEQKQVEDHLKKAHHLFGESLVVNHESMGRPEPLLPEQPAATAAAAVNAGGGDETAPSEGGATASSVQYRLRCCFCFKRFEDRAKALKHLYRHHGFARRLKCQFCEQHFCKSTALHAHMVRCHPEALEQLTAAENAQTVGGEHEEAGEVAGSSDAQPVYIRLGEDQQILEHFVAGEGGSEMQPYELVLLNGGEGLQAGLDASQIQYVQLPPGTDISQFKIADDPNIQVIQMDQGEYARFVSQ